jgi:hypothetical protein
MLDNSWIAATQQGKDDKLAEDREHVKEAKKGVKRVALNS